MLHLKYSNTVIGWNSHAVLIAIRQITVTKHAPSPWLLEMPYPPFRTEFTETLRECIPFFSKWIFFNSCIYYKQALVRDGSEKYVNMCYTTTICFAYIYHGGIAQLVEQHACNRNVASSSAAKAYQTFHPSDVDKLVP